MEEHQGISDLNEVWKTRLGNRIPQESSRGLGNRNLGYSFTTKRVKSIFPAMIKALQLLFLAFSRSKGRRRITWTKASDFSLGGKPWPFLYLYLRVPQQNRSHTSYFHREISIWASGRLKNQIMLKKAFANPGLPKQREEDGYLNPEARRNPTLLISGL